MPKAKMKIMHITSPPSRVLKATDRYCTVWEPGKKHLYKIRISLLCLGQSANWARSSSFRRLLIEPGSLGKSDTINLAHLLWIPTSLSSRLNLVRVQDITGICQYQSGKTFVSCQPYFSRTKRQIPVEDAWNFFALIINNLDVFIPV